MRDQALCVGIKLGVKWRDYRREHPSKPISRHVGEPPLVMVRTVYFLRRQSSSNHTSLGLLEQVCLSENNQS